MGRKILNEFFMKKINLSLIILVAVVISLCISLKPKKQSQPNIVLIFTDDQGYGDLSSYGSETIYTPHLDALAKRVMLFTYFNDASSESTP